MNLDKILKICKTKKRFIVFKQSEKTQWLGDDTAIYLINGYTKFTPAYLTALASLKAEDVEKTSFVNDEFPKKYDTSDVDMEEKLASQYYCTINFSDGEYTPIFSTKGIRFIKTSYFEPFKSEEYDIFERTTDENEIYFVIKVGMFVSAIIVPTDDFINLETVTQFSSLVNKLKYAYELIEMQEEE